MSELGDKIEHVVVLMLENRSFDHMLGAVAFSGSVKQPSGTETNPDADGNPVPISFDAPIGIDVGPDHGHLGVMHQLTGLKPAAKPPYFQKPYVVTNSGFVTSFEETSIDDDQKFAGYGKNIMRCHPEANVPVLATLAKEFAVCDQWFCSVPGQTWPNRNYAHTGTSDGETNIKKRAYDNDTIFERLTEAKKKWRVYHDGIAHVWVFPGLWLSLIFRRRFRSIDRFAKDVAKGDLPEYTFIEPRHFGKKANSQHPENPANVSSFHGGEALIRRVYEALRSNQKIWESMLLLITYDEHGGFYDHEPPPTDAVRPDAKASKEGFLFDTLGVRVPAVLVSPWIPAGTVDSTVYDHSSIAHSVRSLFAPATAKLSDREDVAKTFWRSVSLDQPRTDSVFFLSEPGFGVLKTYIPVEALAAMNDQPPQEELASNEEASAWLAYNVARTLEEERVTGKPATIGTKFFEETKGRLITKRSEARAYADSPLAAAASMAPPVILTDADQLSAYGNRVAEMFWESAGEEDALDNDASALDEPEIS